MKINKLKLIIVVTVIITLFACTMLGLEKYKEYVNSSKEIHSKIDIGGYGLYANCIGRGKPTIIFESGYSCDSSIWNTVQPEIAKATRTFSYDRAGLGRSDFSPLEWSTKSEVYELHVLLEKAKVKGPYIIVAHSIGGFNARLFASTYPKEVLGIVFIDCTHEIIGERLKSLPIEDMNVYYKYLMTCSEQVKQIREKDTLRNIPIIVLTADQKGTELPEEGKKDLKWQQDDIALLSNTSEHIFVKDSSHYIQTDHPGVVINAIKKLINIVNNEKND